ncbi:MAG: zf-HC2 domain-containing protein [Candidatus Eisenbacteria bacterium]
MHLELEDLERYLDGELAPERIPTIEAHLVSCEACRALESTLRREESEVEALLATLDAAPVPAMRERAWIAPPTSPRRLQWAAAIIAIVLAGAAFAMTQAPIGAWVRDRLAHRPAPSRGQRLAPAAPQPSAVTESPAVPMAGVAIDPGASFTIDFAARRDRQTARVEVVDGRQLVVRGPSSLSHFSSSPERLAVENGAGEARFEISIPRTARDVTINAAGTTLLTVHEGVVTSSGAAVEGGAYLLPLDR